MSVALRACAGRPMPTDRIKRMNHADIDLQVLHGEAIASRLEDIARLRIAVFRDWPYLYEGDAAYEAGYLRTYVDAPRSIAVLAMAGGEVVGASTGLPMADEDDAFRVPLQQAGIDIDRVFYCGESVLLPAWRGRGIGHAFFDAREAHARALGGFAYCAFAAVDRESDDARRPPGHRDNDVFWRKRGYVRRDDIRMQLPWRECDRGETDHTLTFWLRPMEDAR